MVTKAILFAPADRHESPERSPHALSAPNPRLAMLPVGNRPLVLHALDELSAAGIEEIAVVSDQEVAEDVQRVIDHWPLMRHAKAHVSVDSSSSFLDGLQKVAPWLGEDSFVVHMCDSLRHDGLASTIADPPTGANDVLALVEAPAEDATPVRRGSGEPPQRRDLRIRPGRARTRRRYRRYAAVGYADRQLRRNALQPRAGASKSERCSDWWRYRQRPDILLQANRFFLSGLKMQPTEARLENTDLQGPVMIDPTARLRSATVRGPVIIGPDAGDHATRTSARTPRSAAAWSSRTPRSSTRSSSRARRSSTLAVVSRRACVGADAGCFAISACPVRSA